MVNEFNGKIAEIIPDSKLFLNFVHAFIIEVINEEHPYKYYYVENFIEGQYEKYNNNAGWLNESVTET